MDEELKKLIELDKELQREPGPPSCSGCTGCASKQDNGAPGAEEGVGCPTKTGCRPDTDA